MMIPMRTLYHLGYSSRRESLHREGIRTSSKDLTGYPDCNIKYENKLFLFSDLNDIPFHFCKSAEVDIWEVKVPEGIEMEKDPFAEQDGHQSSFMVGVCIPPENIRLIETRRNPWD